MRNKTIVAFRAIAFVFAIHCSLFTVLAQSDSTDVLRPALRFGYLSYGAALQSMPDYAIVQQQLADLRAQYQAELTRVKDDFNKKYEEFLEGQREFPRTILLKRQTELQELMSKNIAFKEESRQLLAKAEQEAMAPLRLRLSDLLRKIGIERGYAFILDTDTKALPFIHPETGEDLNEDVRQLLANDN